MGILPHNKPQQSDTIVFAKVEGQDAQTTENHEGEKSKKHVYILCLFSI
jgi:hypothetical protein